MSLTSVLSTALTGLNVNQQALTTLSQNIANANTPGYSRQIINQAAVYIDGQGEGVSIENITRKVDQYLVQAVQQQSSSVGATGVINDYNSRIQQLIGQPGSNNSIDSFITAFFNDLQSLANTPQNTTLQQTVINDGVTLASQTQSLAKGLQNLQFQADQDISGAVSSVNNDIQQLAQVNSAIVNGAALGQPVTGLQDQRDSLLKDLSQYLNIQTFSQNNGAISIATSSGITLLDTNIYQLQYAPTTSVDAFSNGTSLAALTVQRLDGNGSPSGSPVTLVSSGAPTQITSVLSSGKIAGLVEMRDQQLPDILNQIDTLVSSLRDEINGVQNSGSGFPGAASLTGERAVGASDYSQWGGSVRIAVLGADGKPITSPYNDELNGMPPLTLNLSTLNTGGGAGNPSVQGIINAINQYYGVPQNKAEVGNLNNIQLVSDSSGIPGSPPKVNFDFNLNNISASSAHFYVTGVSVTDNLNNPVTSVTSTVPSVSVSSYTTAMNSAVVTVNTVGSNNNLTNGEVVDLSSPGVTVDNIPAGNLTGFFTVSNVTATSFQITALSQAQNGTTTLPVGTPTLTPPYATVVAGSTIRTGANGLITADLSNNSTAPYYKVTVDVAVDGGNGVPQTAQIMYQVNSQPNALGTFFGAQQVTGQGTLVAPDSTKPIATAMLVDASGNELPKIGGQYTTTQNGYLEIKADGSTNVIAIDSLDSTEQGKPNGVPPQAGTGWGFSQYFALNNFFTSNQLTATGDT
ncbi:MAG: flagellar hook-associated protein FlgK, partial [Pseudomonadota bacterium]|nr:flagellar hook-associated protein FlgK [Pseudomonadota bacterium]